MPPAHVHLHLAEKLLARVPVADSDAFRLGSVYPDCWREDEAEALRRHAYDAAAPVDDFCRGWLFHLWTDRRMKTVDTQGIARETCLACDMEVIAPVVRRLRSLQLTGRATDAQRVLPVADNADHADVPEEIRTRYHALLDGLVCEFMKEHK
ncbi:MAG: hypothetical protein IKK21_04190 [Clostridia bacterium]|nr:hypothetical protein [Clostridia bacterium]